MQAYLHNVNSFLEGLTAFPLDAHLIFWTVIAALKRGS